MALQITEAKMVSSETRHWADKTDRGWSVTWLPGRFLDRNEAITAMTIAEIVSAPDFPGVGRHVDDPVRLQLRDFAFELGLTISDAIQQANLTPETHFHVTSDGQYQDLQTGEWKHI